MASKSKLPFLTALLFMLSVSPSWAATATFTLTGHVTDYFGGLDFGLNVGDLVTATGSFDDSLIGGDIVNGSGTLNFTSDITDLLITVGSQTFTSADDNGSGLLVVVNGALLDGLGSAGLVYAGTNAGGHLFTTDAGSETFLGDAEILGVWDTGTIVPEPFSGALVGTALIGVIVIRRRRHADS